jgi:hypothetical protein
MKAKALLASFLLIAASVTTGAQADKVTIELGSVTVWLGMSQSEAMKRFHEAGYLANEPEPGKVTIILDTSQKYVYTVKFVDGSVVSAGREWPLSGTDELTSIIGALSSLADHEGYSCSVRHFVQNSPELAAERISIKCGKRTVLLSQGKVGSSRFVAATESIGEAL